MASSESRRIEYDSGDVYEGEWSQDGKRQGQGRLKMAGGDEYCGEFVNGFFHGMGILVMKDGSRYEGSFELGRYHGCGVYTNHASMKYEGQFYQGAAKGCGLITFPDGSNGQPRSEGRFEGFELIESSSATSYVQKARKNAATARSISAKI